MPLFFQRSRGARRCAGLALVLLCFALGCGEEARDSASGPSLNVTPTPTRLPRSLGPGLGNLSYQPSELFRSIGVIDSPLGHGNVAMVGGYVMVIYSSDGGGRSGDGGIEFWDVSNPRQPSLFKRFDDQNTHALREAHGFAFSTSYPYDVLAAQSERGIQLWDVTDPSAIAPLATLDLPHINGGDYAGIWWVFFQAPYIYAAGVGEGLYVIDAHDPTAPALVNWIATSELGGVSPAQAFAVGNLLILAAHESDRLVTLDISDPVHPRLLQAGRGAFGYSHIFSGGQVLTSGGPQEESVVPILMGEEPIYAPRTLGITDIGHDGSITFVRHAAEYSLDQGGYGSVQDGFFFSGFSKQVAKFDLRDASLVGTASTGINDRDEDFGLVLGNLIWGGNDHGQGSGLFAHQIEPDTRGPQVGWVHPADNSRDQAVSSAIGVSMSDNIDLYSVDTTTFRVAPVGGEAVSGKFSVQMGLVNFRPDFPLALDTDYEVRVEGMRDLVGNPAPLFVSHFRTGKVSAPACRLANADVGLPAQATNATIHFAPLSVEGEGKLEYQWDFGDGERATTTSAEVEHLYDQAGRFNVVLTVIAKRGRASCSAVQIVSDPPTALAASSSSTVAWSEGRVFAINADSDTLTALDASTLRKLWEVPIGSHPRSLAVAPDGRLWVANQDDATLVVVRPADGIVEQTIALPFASQPYGVAVSPNGESVFATLQATRELIKLTSAGEMVARVPLAGKPRGVAVTADSRRVLVTRFMSSPERGEVWAFDADELAPRTIALHFDDTPDSEKNGRGVPNFLTSIAISPDGSMALVPSEKANLARGLFRDGQELTFESRVRTIVSPLDLSSESEIATLRVDLNDRDMAQAALFSPLGDIYFVATQGTNTIEVIDSFRGAPIASLSGSQFDEIEGLGPRLKNLAPQGLAIDPQGTRLFVQNFLSRSVSVYDVDALVHGLHNSAPLLTEISTVAQEKLTRAALFGKRIFYNASDARMSRDGYISCASCHVDGGSDGQVWDFTQTGEGLRNTIELTGRGGIAHGRLHWTANFDEVQDFENDIRDVFSGKGFMRDDRFAAARDPLGPRKAGQSQELDLLAAYVTSRNRFPDSPFRNPDRSLSEAGERGRALFDDLQCASCHTPPTFTDGQRHDVGTIQPSSGLGIGISLEGLGFDTPTLKGIWDTAPYLHNGAAATLADVLDNPTHTGATLTTSERDDLIAYLQQLDDNEPPLE